MRIFITQETVTLADYVPTIRTPSSSKKNISFFFILLFSTEHTIQKFSTLLYILIYGINEE